MNFERLGPRRMSRREIPLGGSGIAGRTPSLGGALPSAGSVVHRTGSGADLLAFSFGFSCRIFFSRFGEKIFVLAQKWRQFEFSDFVRRSNELIELNSFLKEIRTQRPCRLQCHRCCAVCC